MNKAQVFDVLRKILPNTKFREESELVFYLCSHPLHEVTIIVRGSSDPHEDCLLLTNNNSYYTRNPSCPNDVYLFVSTLLANHTKFVNALSKELGSTVLVPYINDTLYQRLKHAEFHQLSRSIDSERCLIHLTYRNNYDDAARLIKYQPHISIEEQRNEAILCPPVFLYDKIKSNVVNISDEFSILDHLKDMEQQVCKFFTKVHIGK